MRTLFTLIVLAGMGFVAWQSDILGLWRPCARPLSYSLGEFDTRFKLSQEDFLKAVGEAEGLWEAALRKEEGMADKELFMYEPKGGKVSINLVYDYRQEATDKLGEIETNLSSGQSGYAKLEAQYKTARAAYEEAKRAYEAHGEAFEQENAAYEAEVKEWNASSRTDKRDYAALEAHRKSLEAEADALRVEQAALKRSVDTVNELANRLNAMAKELNLEVAHYNEVGASRGEEFTGGLYTSDAAGRRVDIFEFENHAELVRVLAHELGHALGLDHVDDPKAIMYYLNQDLAPALSAGDIGALKALCRVE